MNAMEIIGRLKEEKKCSFAYLAEQTGKKRASNISEMLKGNDIQVGNVIKLLDAMGYELVAQPKKGLKGEKYVVECKEV